MRVLGFVFVLVVVISWPGVQAQEQAPTKEPVKGESHDNAAKPAESNSAVDDAKVKGSTFDSAYFNFTYELPKGWKALEDTARISANRSAQREQEEDRAAEMKTPLPKKASTRPAMPKKGPGPSSSRAPLPLSYSLMVASSSPVESLASPVLPRINIWANQRVSALDNPTDHAQFLASGKRTQVLMPVHEVTLNGNKFVRVDVITPTGEYVSEFVSVIREYLVGFDFRAQSERELAEMTETMKTLKFR
jgi:hypothetical protein